jgi:hypothetical protein
VIHEGHAKLRYFDLGTGVLRRTLFLEGSRSERGSQALLNYEANCTVVVTLAQSRPLSNITLLFDDEHTATQWQHAIAFAVSSSIPPPVIQNDPARPSHPSPQQPPRLPQCIICLGDITSASSAIHCPNSQHHIHKGECFDGCVQSQVEDARRDPGQFNSRGNRICCPACPQRGAGAWADADIKRHVKSSIWQVRADAVANNQNTRSNTNCACRRC